MEKDIFHIEPSKFELSGDYLWAAVEQYKAHVQTLISSSVARWAVHSIFIAGNTLIFAGYGVSSTNGNPMFPIAQNYLMGATVIGCVFSFVWWGLIFAYRLMRKAILITLVEIEKKLPLQLFATQYEMTRYKKNAKGERKKVHYCIRSMDLLIPWVFAVIHLSILIGIISGFFKLGVV
ncbi:hypothetical protein HYW58_01825 [Candidatus Kaiserbacteria bacterium]|nr:hypothetical protein [Candidatus Kaiserbacteria bacterium]